MNLLTCNWVYYPTLSNELLENLGINIEGSITVVHRVSGKLYKCGVDGRIYTAEANPSVYPATQEWYEKLKPLYPNLAEYKKPLVGSDLTRFLLKNPDIPILCRVSEISDEAAMNNDNFQMIEAYHTYDLDQEGRFLDSHEDYHAYAVPVSKLEVRLHDYSEDTYA